MKKIESNPEVRGGEPVIEGTRIPARKVAHLVARGEALESILKHYPTLDEESVQAAVEWDARTPDEKELKALATLARRAAESCREDMIGAIMHTGAFRHLDDPDWAVVRLARKIDRWLAEGTA